MSEGVCECVRVCEGVCECVRVCVSVCVCEKELRNTLKFSTCMFNVTLAMYTHLHMRN